jgi:hypothetical protein
MALVNGCWFRATTGGTGSFEVASAITGYMTPAQADAEDGATYGYRAESDDNSQWEIGEGVYTASGTVLSRSVLKSSNSNAAVNFSAAPRVMLTPLASDLTQIEVPLLSYDFSVGSPIDELEVEIDVAEGFEFILRVEAIRADDQVFDTSDYLSGLVLQFLDIGDAELGITEVFNPGLYANEFGRLEHTGSASIFVAEHGAAWVGQSCYVDFENVSVDVGVERGATEFSGAPVLPAKMIIYAEYYDDSVGDYTNKVDLVSGKIYISQIRRFTAP